MVTSPRRVLVVAYACEPGRGSEPGAGWEWAAAASERHAVHLVTSVHHAGPVRAALAEPDAPPVAAVHFLEESVGPMPLRRGPWATQARYRRWQRAAGPVLRRLHDEHRFDLAHHLTWGADWQPAAATDIPGLPSVWGPVGGTTPTSLRLARWLGARGLASELAREAVTRAGRRLSGDRIAGRVALILAQNEDVRRRFEGRVPIEVAPNPAMRLPPDLGGSAPARRERVAVFAGRLVSWKGLRLAVAAVGWTEDWRLEVFGGGPEEGPARRLAERLGCDDRVVFHGRRARSEVLRAIAGAEALLMPSVHDSGPWVVAEAVTLGTPVVCLDRGGPPELARVPLGGLAVPADRRAPRNLADALDHLPPIEPVDWWRSERLPAQIEGHYRRAVALAGR